MAPTLKEGKTTAEDISSDSEAPRPGAWKRLTWWLPPLAWMAVIFYFSSQSGLPQAESGLLDFAIKKLAHLFEYAVLACLLLRACRSSASLRRSQAKPAGHPLLDGPALAAIGLAALWAVLDEFHQSFVPTRTATLRDVLIDFAAILLSVLAVAWWQQRQERRQYRQR
jgi:VanZ family protein